MCKICDHAPNCLERVGKLLGQDNKMHCFDRIYASEVSKLCFSGSG